MPAPPAGAPVGGLTSPQQAVLIEDPPKIANGVLTLKEQRELGLTLSDQAVKKFGERIL